MGLERITTVPLDAPVEIATHGGRVYVLEQGGLVRIVAKDGVTATTVIDLSTKVVTGGEAGLLGIAFHPKFAANGFVYLYFTAPHVQQPAPAGVAFQSVLARYTSSDGGLTLDPASEKRILVVDQPFSNHNGGTILFGKDGFLYWGLGDGGAGGDPNNNAQNKDVLLGKMLRIDVDSGDPYGIPATNPFAISGGRKEIYALGLRNPYRFRFDDATGDLWAGDVGQAAREEIDKITLGANYGWRIREGKTCYNAMTCDTAGLVDPVVDHGRTEATSITGGVVYHGTKVPGLTGKYVYGDFAQSELFAIATNEAQPTPLRLTESPDVPRVNPSAFTLDPDGEILVASYTQGALYRVVPAKPPPTAPAHLSETGCVNRADPTKPADGLVPYDVAIAQWMDGNTAARFLALPKDAKMKVLPDARLELPPGGVAMRMVKSPRGVPLEVQFLSRKGDGTYAAHRYVWATTESDATLDSPEHGGPSAQCLRCHDPTKRPTIGLEAAQLDRTGVDYGSGRIGNPLATLDHLGMLDGPIVRGSYRALPPIDGFAQIDQKARGYLHANCAFCHGGGAGQTLDLRYATPIRSTQACDVPGSLATGGRLRLAPGRPDDSQIVTSMKATTDQRMPPVGTTVPDETGIRIVSDFIRTLPACD
jgi:glucose/arabinose dehydrogenase